MSGTGAAASYGDLLVTSLVVLGVVCIAAFVVVRLLGRALSKGRARGGHLLDVVARVPLEPRRSLYVVEVAGKTLLVGTSEMGMSLLTELDGAEVRARAVAPTSFGDLVKQAWARRGGLGSARLDVDGEGASLDAGPRAVAPGASVPSGPRAVPSADGRADVSTRANGVAGAGMAGAATATPGAGTATPGAGTATPDAAPPKRRDASGDAGRASAHEGA